MALFDLDDATCTVGYRNLRNAPAGTVGAEIKEGLEGLWGRYEAYADTDFSKEFVKQVEPRFWEMYLTVCLLASRRKLRPRAELPDAKRNEGPDICIFKGRRKIWIEAIAPSPGDDKNLDRVPDLFLNADGAAQDMPERQVHYASGALWTKLQAFQRYKQNGIVGDNDSCIVAISAAQFALEAAGEGLSHAVKAVYPFGEEFIELNRRTFEVVGFGHRYSDQINRAKKKDDPILRTAFQDERFADISGLIWSRRSIGNFLGQPDDLVYVHNQVARKPIPRKWARWAEEFYTMDEGTTLRLKNVTSSSIWIAAVA
jgi:hypothetical protein